MFLLITNVVLLFLLSLIIFADLDECAPSQPCTNLSGCFKCYTPNGLICNGRKDQDGTAFPQKAQATSWSRSIYFTLGILVVAPAMASAWVFSIEMEKKLLNHRGNIFEQNGGNLLMKKVSKLKEPAKKQIRVYTANEMRKATNNYRNKILYTCRPETCYLARVADGENKETEVVIMKIPRVPRSHIKQFVDRLIFLSQRHENLVKIIGCCLETDPLLVYEHHGGTSLFDRIYDDNMVAQFSCQQRLKAAAGAAGALAYLHSQNSCRSIVHGNVTSAHIILDDSSEAKLFYDVASNLIPQDIINSSEQNYVHRAPVLSRSPRRFFWQRSSRLNQRSDVYSFGNVLKEVLKGWEGTSPAKQQMEKEIAALASKCSSKKPEERPTMKEVKGKLNMLMQKSYEE